MNKKILTTLLSLVLAIALFAGCTQPAATPSATTEPTQSEQPSESAAPSETASSSDEGNTAQKDMLGNEVNVVNAEKIVSLTPAGTEIVYALGAGDKLVGVDVMSNFPKEAQNLEIVGDYNGPDIEKITALEPDVIFASSMLQKEPIDQLKELGLNVVSVEATTFEQIPESISLIGMFTGSTEKADELNQSIADAVAKAKETIPAEQKTVYYAMSYGDNGNWTSGPGSFVNSIIEIAGGKCVTENAEFPWVEYSMEDLAAANPDIILVASDSGDVDSLSKTAGYSDLDAVKNGKVIVVDADILSRPGPRVIDAIQMVAEILNK